MTKRQGSGGDIGFGGVFEGLADLIEKIGDLAEKGEHSRKAGKFITRMSKASRFLSWTF